MVRKTDKRQIFTERSNRKIERQRDIQRAKCQERSLESIKYR